METKTWGALELDVTEIGCTKINLVLCSYLLDSVLQSQIVYLPPDDERRTRSVARVRDEPNLRLEKVSQGTGTRFPGRHTGCASDQERGRSFWSPTLVSWMYASLAFEAVSRGLWVSMIVSRRDEAFV